MHLSCFFVCLLLNNGLVFAAKEMVLLTAVHSSLVAIFIPGIRRRICVDSLQTCIRGCNQVKTTLAEKNRRTGVVHGAKDVAWAGRFVITVYNLYYGSFQSCCNKMVLNKNCRLLHYSLIFAKRDFIYICRLQARSDSCTSP